MTFSADKSVSALWAIADPELRSEIEQAHNDAARVALEETVFRHCGWTRIRDRDGQIQVLPADLMAAMFQHGTSRDNDPQLHTHCVIFNAARAPGRTAGGGPCTSTRSTAGPRRRARSTATRWPGTCIRAWASPWSSTAGTGSSPAIKGVPEDLRGALVEAARGDRGRRQRHGLQGGGQRGARGGGEQDHAGGEVARQRPRSQAPALAGRGREVRVEREELIAELLGKAEDITQEQLRELTDGAGRLCRRNV